MKKSQAPEEKHQGKEKLTPEQKQQLRLALAERVLKNPYEYLSSQDIATLFNFGEDSMSALILRNPPMVAKKINPASFKAWLDRQGDVGKLN